ncbi:NEW3 domain-containing protein [Georgenia wangjunii]|uniref:NEW3 domain-containing protein n=1 Tax=Georgenia wangjunii TaxID=3117730 RepID=UPI002F262A3F
MKRKALALPAVLALLLGGGMSAAAAQATLPPLEVGEPSISTEVDPTKIDIMGLWAHPDDDASFTTPCGVWHDLYDIRCGIVMETRGEGGSNSVGDEAGPALGLRRENEDRASHWRSGTIDIYNVDRVDFFYNTSAPLTAQVWDAEEGLRQTVRIIRETRPEILIGFSPAPAGHGNHQYAGRLIWETAAAAADPTMFPEQLTGPDAVEPWQVKKIVSGASNQGEGGTAGPSCTVGFTPAPTNPFTVHGVWTGYESPYTWAEGNVQGQPAGTAKTWAQVGREGARAHPTQARSMEMGVTEPGCTRYGVAQAFVPFQPNSSPEAGNDDALFYGASIPDPGGMPLGSLLHLATDDYFHAAGEPFEVTVHSRSGEGTLPAGSVELDVPAGWDVSAAQDIGPITPDADATATFTVTPGDDATPGRYKLAATLTSGAMTGYTDSRVEIAAPVEGRFARWGNFVEYEEWAAANTYISGRAPAREQIGAGETISLPVVVTNRTSADQDGEVSITLPEGFTADSTTLPYTGLAGGAETTVTFEVTHTDPDAAGGTTVDIPITTTYSEPAGSASETLQVIVVPTTVIPELDATPTLDAVDDDEYGDAIEIGGRWEGAECDPDGTDCGDGSYAKIAWQDDALYAFIHVVDDTQSAAAPPERCFGHWLVDSVEVLLDPRGDSVDTSTTFKSGIFPFTDDPTGSAGNGENGPCWTRDADNHQGFSSGPLADTVEDGPNAPGMEVVSDAEITPDGAYAGGAYNVEIKIPLDVLPAAVGPTSTPPTGEAETNDVDPDYLGLNITPYDSDNQDFIGETRTAWSPFGSQQSEPYRWGHAYLDGYTPPEGRSTTPDAPRIPDTALQGVESPQTVHQSAVRGVTISGLQPSRAMTVTDVTIDGDSVDIAVESTEQGTARAFLWHGEHGFIPVWESSCPGDTDGFDACSLEDGSAPPWSPDMGGRLLGMTTVQVGVGVSGMTLPIDDVVREALRADGSILISFQSAENEVNAWYFPVVEGEVPTPTPTPTTQEPTTDPTTDPTGTPTDPATDPTTPGGEPTRPGGGGELPSTGAPLAPVGWAALAMLIVGLAVIGARRAGVEH